MNFDLQSQSLCLEQKAFKRIITPRANGEPGRLRLQLDLHWLVNWSIEVSPRTRALTSRYVWRLYGSK